MACPILLSKFKSDQISSVEYGNIFGSIEDQRKVINVLIQLLEIRNKLLEVLEERDSSLPVGTTGPEARIKKAPQKQTKKEGLLVDI